MTSRYCWSWFALAALIAAALLWTHRYEYQACDLDGCVAIHRWSGRVYFEPIGEPDGPPPGGSLMVGRRVSSAVDAGRGQKPRTAAGSRLRPRPHAA